MRAAPGLTIALALAGSTLAAQIPTPNPSSKLVTLDAVVTDARGAAVRTLKADDFTIVEGGVAEKVESATFVAADADTSSTPPDPIESRESEKAAAARPGTTVFAFFLDEYHVAAGAETERVKATLSHFIERDLRPQDLAVVVKPLDSLLTFRLTHEKRELLAAVSTFEGRKGNYVPKNAFEQNYVGAPARTEGVRAQIVTSALDALARHIGSLQSGRKTLLVISEGFARGVRRNLDALPTVDAVARDANRGGVSIYALDPRALDPATTPNEAEGERDALRFLATETDGRAVFTAADAAAALPRMAADSRGYYVLTFHPAHPAELRTFHPVDLQVKGQNLGVHARKGYWAASPDELLLAREERRASLPLPPPQPLHHVSPYIRPWFGVARADWHTDGTMEVSFVWEAVPPVPGDRVRRGPPALVTIRANRTTDGALVFEGEALPQNLVAFDTAPGRLLVQTEIQDADANVLDTDVRDVIVGGLAGRVELGTPEVVRAGNAKEFRELAADLEATPAASRDFSRADHLLVRLPVYSGDAPLTVAASVSGKTGLALRQLPMQPVAGTSLYQTDLPLSVFAAGSYTISITATGPEGNATETVEFRVVP